MYLKLLPIERIHRRQETLDMIQASYVPSSRLDSWRNGRLSHMCPIVDMPVSTILGSHVPSPGGMAVYIQSNTDVIKNQLNMSKCISMSDQKGIMKKDR